MSAPLGTAPLSRGGTLRQLLAFIQQQPLDNDRYLRLVNTIMQCLPLLTGAPQPLPPELRQTLLTQLQFEAPPKGRMKADMSLRLLDICAVGEDGALLQALQDLIQAPTSELRQEILAVCRNINTGGRFLHITLELALQALLVIAKAAPTLELISQATELMGLAAHFPQQSRDVAFREIFLPLFRHIAHNGTTEAALQMELRAYMNYIRVREEPEHHRAAFAAIEPLQAVVASRDPRRAPPPRSQDGLPRIAFLLNNGTRLAHTEVLLSFLEGLVAMPDLPIRPVVYCANNHNIDQIAGPLQKLGVPLLSNDLPTRQAVDLQRYDTCREQLAAEGIDAVVFVSLPLHLAYLTHAPLAPVQIWWSMKFALPNFPGLDGRVFYRSLLDRATKVDGVTWRGGPIGLPPPPEADPAAVAAVRAQYPGKRILGTIAREEKIRERSYLDAVVRLLQRYPDTCFLWTGRKRLPEIDQHFRDAGVAERCHFVGWVDPAVYCRVFDLFLETYPLTGLMAAWSMALGKPVLSVGRLGFIGTYLEAIFDGTIPLPAEDRARLDAIFAPVADRLPALWAATPAEMDGIADALLADEALCAALGQAQQRFMQTYLSDPVGAAAVQARHFAAIVAEKLGKAA